MCEDLKKMDLIYLMIPPYSPAYDPIEEIFGYLQK